MSPAFKDSSLLQPRRCSRREFGQNWSEDSMHLVRLQRSKEPDQPVIDRSLVVINERDKVSSGVSNRAIPGQGNVSLGLAIIGEPDRCPHRRSAYDSFSRTFGIVVNDDDLVREQIVGRLTGQRLQKIRQELR